MAAIAHSPAFAKKVGVPQSVGQDFDTADKGRKFSKGGSMAKSNMKDDTKQDKAMVKKAFKQHDAQEHKGGKGTTLKLAEGGMGGGESPSGMGGQGGGMSMGRPGRGMGVPPRPAARPVPRPAPRPMGGGTGGMGRPDNYGPGGGSMGGGSMGGGGMKKGGAVGSFRSAANGIATKGKTKGTQIVMKKGGKC